MRSHTNSKFVLTSGVLVALLLLSFKSWSQKPADTSGKVPVDIIHTTYFEFRQTDSGSVNKFIGDVQFRQGTDLLFCDSAYLVKEKNNIQAFGNVRIQQANGTEVLADYMSYTGNAKTAFLRGNVSLTNGTDNLWTEELTYNLTTRVGIYARGGTLQNGATTVSSINGLYNGKDKEARFTDSVFVTDPQYTIVSKDLGYNTESGIMRFFDSSVVSNPTSILHASNGTYDSRRQSAHFTSRSSIQNNQQYIEADTIHYDRVSGDGLAMGNVVVLDTQQHSTLYCGRALYNERRRSILATIKPVLKQSHGNDSLFTRADTFFSEHIKTADTSKIASTPQKEESTKSSKTKKAKTAQAQQPTEKTGQPAQIKFAGIDADVDTTAPRYYIGYHHVRIFSDSLQGKCDSISFSMKDSTMKMMKNPVVWTRKSQLTGDMIIAYMDSGKVRKIYIPENALLVSQSGPPKAQLYDQVQGKTLTANLINNALTDAVIKPNAESIFYPTDDSGAYIGASQAQSERMKAFFNERKIDKILLEQEVRQTLTPMKQVDIPNMRLSRFKWLDSLRPRSIYELFE